MEEELCGHDGGFYILCGLDWYMVVEIFIWYLHGYILGGETYIFVFEICIFTWYMAIEHLHD